MSILYNSQNVDESYSDKLEANLYYGSVLVPGVTCSDDFLRGPGGGVFIHRLNGGSVLEPSAPGTDFNDEETADTLIPVLLNNCFQRSRKIYNVQAAACAADLKDANLAAAQAEVREGWCLSGLACLVQEGTASSDTTAPTKENCIGLVIDARREIIEGKGTADVVLCSPSFYALVLKQAGSDFLPTVNDRIRSEGNVGTYLGMTWVEANAMGVTGAKYYDHDGTLRTVDLSGTDFIVYDHDTLSVITNVSMARLADSELFNGCKAQVEQNTGYRVRNTALTRRHTH